MLPSKPEENLMSFNDSIPAVQLDMTLCLFLAEAVSKLEIRRFLGVALPFPRFREADRERPGASTSSLNGSSARFDTASADYCPM
jgi:hypothetical protein